MLCVHEILLCVCVCVCVLCVLCVCVVCVCVCVCADVCASLSFLAVSGSLLQAAQRRADVRATCRASQTAGVCGRRAGAGGRVEQRRAVVSFGTVYAVSARASSLSPLSCSSSSPSLSSYSCRCFVVCYQQRGVGTANLWTNYHRHSSPPSKHFLQQFLIVRPRYSAILERAWCHVARRARQSTVFRLGPHAPSAKRLHVRAAVPHHAA